MVWTPDILVTEFCTRDTEPDASNRARYHCNACLQKFPLGNVTEMRDHLVNCSSLDSATIDSIKERIRTERSTPKRVTRDPRWTEAEEKTLMRLDEELPTGKGDHRYQKMAGKIGRSAQACRQKLIHLKEAQAVKNCAQKTTKRVLWTKKTKSSENKSDEDADIVNINAEIPSAIGTRRTSRRSQPLRSMREESSSTTPEAAKEDSEATISDIHSPTRHVVPVMAGPGPSKSEAAEEFLRLFRWNIADALTRFRTIRGFYTSELSIQEGWRIFVASRIPQAVKDRIVARLIGLWLDGLDTRGFEREVDAEIECVVQEMSEWKFKGSNPMVKAMEELSTDEEDSGYDADSSFEDDVGREAIEI